MTDLVERLYKTVQQGLPDRDILIEAAAEIERLREALQQIIERYAASEEGWPAEDMRAIARAALEPKP
jgi:Glu-tRNA(Gln) amidotransferase subunit E-like FAD-binding protein